MTSNRKILGAAGFTLALAAGGVAGAALGTPSLSGAQDEADDTTSTTPDERSSPRRGLGDHAGEPLTTVAEVLGMSKDELRTQLAEGASIASVAEAQGVDVQDVVDALVAEAGERIDEIETALPERITDLVNREGLGGGRIGRHLGQGLEAAADALGISTEELRSQLAGGSTLREVAEAQGVEVQVLIDALVAEAEAHLAERIAERGEDGGPFRGGPFRGGRRHLG